MAKSRQKTLVLVIVILAVFSSGYLIGSTRQQAAQAQIEQLTDAVKKQAAGSGGVVGSAVELADTISQMQTHVDGLQKNIEVLKKVQKSLGM